VRSTFVLRFGNTLHWWSVVLFLVAAVVLLELAAQALRVTFWTQAEDVWRLVESEGGVRAGEGGAGDGLAGPGPGPRRETTRQADDEREREVGDLLKQRGDGGAGHACGVDGGAVESMLSRGFGEVKT